MPGRAPLLSLPQPSSPAAGCLLEMVFSSMWYLHIYILYRCTIISNVRSMFGWHSHAPLMMIVYDWSALISPSSSCSMYVDHSCFGYNETFLVYSNQTKAPLCTTVHSYMMGTCWTRLMLLKIAKEIVSPTPHIIIQNSLNRIHL